MLFLIDVNVNDRGLSLDGLFAEWEKETAAVIGEFQTGIVKHVFKVVGERRVMAFVDLPSHEALDDLLMGQLPLSHHLEINKIAAIRDYDNFAGAVKRRFAPE